MSHLIKDYCLHLILSSGVMFYLVEERRVNEIYYRIHEYYDGTISEVLDCRQSPILEYSLSYKNTEDNYYIRGRFYCCSEDEYFEKKVSRFFLLLKKKFWYVKKYKVYVSKSIDIFAAKFENGRIITKEDLS